MGAARQLEQGDAFGPARRHLAEMEKRLSSRKMMTAEHSELEELVIAQGRELQRLLLQAHMDLREAHERAVEVTGADGVPRRTLRASARSLMSLVGEVDVGRTAYEARDVPGLHPMDASLNMPGEKYSHGVRRFVAENAAVLSFDDVRHLLLRHTGARVPKRQIEELAVRAAVDFDAFYAERRADERIATETDDLLVLSFDGKGIVMVPEGLRPETRKAAEKGKRKLTTRLTWGEKRNRKRVAQVAALYSVPRFVRTPLDVLADLDGSREDEPAPERPKLRGKRVVASVEREPEDVIEEIFLDAKARDPRHERTWVVLVDGHLDQLAAVHAMAEKHGRVHVVLDLIHVLEHLWEAAHAMCGFGTKQAEAWVQQRLLWLLQDRPAGKIATAMRAAARRAKLTPARLKAVESAAKYLQKFAEYMHYGAALREGYPMATGVIEGACRHLVKDRMDRGGARWTVAGAEAVLRLRALRICGDFDDYWALHLREELGRNHSRRYADGVPPDPVRRLRSVK